MKRRGEWGCVGLLVVAVLLLILGSSKDALAAAKTDLERGNALIRSKGCTACHSIDGTPRVGPTFLGLWGSTRKVQTSAGETKEVLADDAFLARSLREPDAEIAVGFPKGNMPKLGLSDDEVHAIGLALAEMKVEPPAEAGATKRGGSILPLALSSAAFAILHFFLSAIPIRKKIIGALNDKAFRAIYSIIALGTFVAMMWFYRTAPYIEVWSPPRFMRWVPITVMPFAILFMVAGFSTPNPTSVGQEAKAKESPRGILAVTRHPGLWGFALWGLAHIAANGELHVILVALSIVVLAIGGMVHIDSRRRAELGEDWNAFAMKTSIIPFAALISVPTTKLRLSEIGIVRVLITFVVFMTILHTHALVIGASPFP